MLQMTNYTKHYAITIYQSLTTYNGNLSGSLSRSLRKFVRKFVWKVSQNFV